VSVTSTSHPAVFKEGLLSLLRVVQELAHRLCAFDLDLHMAKRQLAVSSITYSMKIAPRFAQQQMLIRRLFLEKIFLRPKTTKNTNNCQLKNLENQQQHTTPLTLYAQVQAETIC
jgi:hypothetical protein